MMTPSNLSSKNSIVRNQHFIGLQIHRGFAALLVLLFHCSGIAIEKFDSIFAGNVFKIGNAGVDFFFVLSGFLITYIHRKDIGQPRQFKQYFFKRTIRVLPVYWLITLIILPVYFVIPTYGQGDETRLDVIVRSLLLIPMSRAPILVAGWTLCYEMLFYTLFGFLIVFGWKWLKYVLAAWAIAVAYTCITHFDQSVEFANPFIKLILWPQNLEFMLGCLAAYLANIPAIQSTPRSLWITVVGLLSIAFIMLTQMPDEYIDLSRGKHTIVYSVLSFGIVMGLSQLHFPEQVPSQRRAFSIVGALALLGDASYSLYLLHGPCISVLFKLMKYLRVNQSISMNLIVLVVIAITIMASILFHWFVEKKLLEFCRKRFIMAK